MAQYAPYATSAEWHPSLSNQHRSNILSKRKADDELDSQSHISSQFKKLRLNQNQNHVNQHANATVSQTYTPQHHYPCPAVPSPQPSSPTSPTVIFRPHIANTDARPALAALRPGSNLVDSGIDHHDFALPSPAIHPSSNPAMKPPPPPETDFMTIDETPNRIIIHDLTSEIAEIEAEEARHSATLFLPDLDKKVSSLPHHLFQSQNHDRNMHIPQMAMGMQRPPENLSTALILYRDPSSISVPEEEDVVRKTIIEARRRAREKTAAEQRERERQAREAETRALQEHWDDGMVDHSFHHRAEDTDTEGEGEIDDDLDLMDIE